MRTADSPPVKPGRSRDLKDPLTVPRHGPHASAEWAEGEGRWRVALNDSGRELVARLFAKYPAPVTLLTAAAPKLYHLVVRLRNGSNEMVAETDQVAAAGVCQAATYFDEGQARGTFEGFAAWHVRAALGRWLKQNSRHAAATLSGFEASPEPPPLSPDVRALLARLPEADRKLLTAAFGLDGKPSGPTTWAGHRKLKAAIAAAAVAAGVK